MRKLTLAQVNKASEQTRMTAHTLSMVKQVLVEGRSVPQVAQEYEVAPQRVQAVVKRIYDIHLASRKAPKGWEQVNCWLPSKRAREVEKESKALLIDYYKKQEKG